MFERIPEATRRLRNGSPISPWPGWELLLDAIGPGAEETVRIESSKSQSVGGGEALGDIVRLVHLTNPRYHVRPVSNALHGRDVFSPVAAHLAAGVDLDDLGEGAEPASMASLDFPGLRWEPGGGIAAEIINIDRFGNARLSVMQEDLDLRYGMPLEIEVRDEVIQVRYVETFGTAEDGDLVAVPDSHWRLSLAVNRGNAARALLLSLGEEVHLKPSAETV